MNKLLQYLRSIHPLPIGLQEHLFTILKTTEVRKRERLLKTGQVCSNVYFIEKGLFRCSYPAHSKEVCAWFMKEGDVIISVGSFFKQQPSYQTISAMEESRVHSISYVELQRIYRNYPEFNFIGRVLTEKYYDLCEERLYSLRMRKAAERYHYFLKQQPELARRVPATYIASYLGISLETLSRIKNKK